VASEAVLNLVVSGYLYGIHIYAWIWATNLRHLMAPCWWGPPFILPLFMYWVCGNDVHVSIMDSSWAWELANLVYIPDHIPISCCHHQKGTFSLQLVKERHHYSEENKAVKLWKQESKRYPTLGEPRYQRKCHIHYVSYVLMLIFYEFSHIAY
jgi:hypothetical protein